MSFYKDIIQKIKNKIHPEVPKIACPRCSEIHELNPEAVCPKCGAKYKLDGQYLELARKSAERKNAEKSGKKGVDIKGRALAFLESIKGLFSRLTNKRSTDEGTSEAETSPKNSKKSRGIPKGIIYAAALVVLCAVFVGVTVTVFSDKEPLNFKTAEPKDQPMFFSDTDGIVHYLFPNGNEGNIGKGTLCDYASSADGKTVYLTFTGLLSPSEGIVGNTEDSSFLLSLRSFSSPTVVLESKTSVPEIIAAGDCEYLYVMLYDEQDTRMGSLSMIHNGETTEIAPKVKDICVSPNGRYALISVDDSGASKLMKYNLAKNALENPGIKNAYPLSIDNKGEYMVYAKKLDSTNLQIVSERNTSERVEIPVFADSRLQTVIFAADRRSFALRYNDRMTFYACGTDLYSTMAVCDGPDFCYDHIPALRLNILSTESLPDVVSVAQTELLPYHYFDSDTKTVYCLDNGTQTQVFGKTIDHIAVADNSRCAFISDGKLYCGVVDTKNNKLFEMGEFGGKTLVGISPDGKLIAYSDGDGNLFTLEYGKTIAQQNMGIKRSVDVTTARFSENSKHLLVTSDGVTSLISLGNGKENVITTDIIPEQTCVQDGSLSLIAYASKAPDTGDGTEQKTLYLYKNGKSAAVSENFETFLLADTMGRIDYARGYMPSTAR